MNPLVSIIINNYNYEKYLIEAIESSLNQTYQNIEVIVVDDGSTDHSKEIIARYEERVIPVFKKNGGQGSAFNEGFRESAGDIILYLDSDDALYGTCIQRVVKKFAENGNLVKLHFRLDIVDENGVTQNKVVPKFNDVLLEGNISDRIMKFGPACYCNPPTSGNAYSRSALQRVLPMPTEAYKISADSYLFMTIPLLGDLGKIDDSLGIYRVHQKNNYWQTTLDISKLKRQVELYDHRVVHLQEFIQKLKSSKATFKWISPFLQATRLTTLKLDASPHKNKEDHLFKVYREGISSIWRWSIESIKVKVLITMYLTMIVLLPRKVGFKLANWFFIPDSRPF